MLQSITMRNFALIEETTIDFSTGLHVLTGETGAGKSIVIDAVNLVLGGRVDKGLIRTGTTKAYVEAIFDISNSPHVKELLKSQEIEVEANQLYVSREISENGKNIARLCGIMVHVSLLKQVASFLLDVHGQHGHQSLMDGKKHLAILDSVGDKTHEVLLESARHAYECFIDVHRKYANLVKNEKAQQQKIDLIRYELNELKNANLLPREDEILNQEKNIIKNAEHIAQQINIAHYALAEDDQGNLGAVGQIKVASDALAQLSDIDEVYRQAYKKLNNLYYELEDVALTVFSLRESSVYDPKRAGEIEERLDIIKRLSKKYKPTVDEMLAHITTLEQELEPFDSGENDRTKLKELHRNMLRKYRETARELTQKRLILAKAFEDKMMKELSELGMNKTRFIVDFKKNTPDEKPSMPTAQGDDVVEFLISPNPGEPLKPLSQIASGGELSRLMLAIKAISADVGDVESMVFDEIDTGISGKMAQVVAQKMASIAKHRQVICVTHLPQIAAMADKQYLVEKHVKNERTYTLVRCLTEDERAEELARMISGADSALESGYIHANVMLASANAYKLAEIDK